MMFKQVFGLLAVVIAVIQYTPYIRDVLARKTKPHVFSWFIWGPPCAIVYVAQLMKGGGAGSWATGVTVAFCSFIFLLSLFLGEKTITRTDWAALGLAVLAFALWGVTKDPLGSVILMTLADVIGCVPTMRKSMEKPYEETLSTYLVANFKWALSLMALDSFSLTTTLYPFAMFFANGMLVALLFYRRRAIAARP